MEEEEGGHAHASAVAPKELWWFWGCARQCCGPLCSGHRCGTARLDSAAFGIGRRCFWDSSPFGKSSFSRLSGGSTRTLLTSAEGFAAVQRVVLARNLVCHEGTNSLLQVSTVTTATIQVRPWLVPAVTMHEPMVECAAVRRAALCNAPAFATSRTNQTSLSTTPMTAAGVRPWARPCLWRS